jgi:hypothetical protein
MSAMRVVDELEDNQSDDDEPEPIDSPELSKNYKIVVPRQQKFVLLLQCTPDITYHGKRQIQLPIEIKGAGKTPDLRRVLGHARLRCRS